MPNTREHRATKTRARDAPPVQDGTPPTTAADRRERKRRAQELRSRLDKEEAALARWMTRLKRAFRAVEKHQRCIGRVRRQLAQVEG